MVTYFLIFLLLVVIHLIVNLHLSVDAAPKVVLNDPCAFSWGNPIANSTCEGSNRPDVQALPLDAQIPSKSNDKKLILLQ